MLINVRRKLRFIKDGAGCGWGVVVVVVVVMMGIGGRNLSFLAPNVFGHSKKVTDHQQNNKY